MAWPVWLLRLADGRIVVGCIFTFDSLTSQYQTKIYKRYKNTSHWQMMLGGNFFAVITTLTVAVANHVYAVFVGLPVSEKSVGKVSQASLVKLGLFVGLDQRLGASVDLLYHQTVWSFDLSVDHDDPQGALRRVLLNLVQAPLHSKKSDVYPLVIKSMSVLWMLRLMRWSTVS